MTREIRERSQIDSFGVSFGPAPKQAASASQKQLEKWNILVCSDLGYISQKPCAVGIAEWNEFVAAQGAVVSGTVDAASCGEAKPLFVEIPVKSMKDLTSESIAASVAPLSGLSKTLFGLEQLLDGKAGRNDVLALIRKAGLSAAEEARVASLLDVRPNSLPKKPEARPRNSSIDNILSMVDGTSSAGDGDAPQGGHTATDALFKSVAGSEESPLDKAAIDAYVRECRARLQRMTDAVVSQPFFASRKASWNCLMTLAKVIGRKKEVCLHVFSGPQAHAEDSLTSVLSSCMEASVAADMIVWDYDVTFTNASVDAMAQAASAADQYKCVMIAPLSMSDPLMRDLACRESVMHFFDEVRFLPFKKLRTGSSARCLCLCGPTLSPLEGYASSAGRCPWFVATRWVEMLLVDNNPFGACDVRPPLDGVFPQDAVFSCTVAPSVALEARAMGLTLFEQSLRQASLDKAVTLIAGEAAMASYASVLFNLVVNRAVRLSGIKTLAQGAGVGRVEVTSVLEKLLRTELSAYGVISADQQVAIAAVNDGTINVVVDSDATVAGYKVNFTFSF